MSSPSAPGYVWRPAVAPPVTVTTAFWQTSTNNEVQVVTPPTANIARFSAITFNQVPAAPPQPFVPQPSPF